MLAMETERDYDVLRTGGVASPARRIASEFPPPMLMLLMLMLCRDDAQEDDEGEFDVSEDDEDDVAAEGGEDECKEYLDSDKPV